MNNKIAVGIGFAFATFFGVYYSGILVLRWLAGMPQTPPALMLAVSDGMRMLGPIIGGYILGRTFARRGSLVAFVFAFVGFVVIESIGHPPWYYAYDYFSFIGILFVTHFGVPAALAGGCGQLHSTLKAQGVGT